MLLEPPFPRGCWRPPDDGRAGPVINTTHHHHKQNPTTTGGLSWAPWRGESARFLIVVRRTLPSPSLSFPSAPLKVWRRQLLSVVRCCLSLGGVREGKGEARACRKGTDLRQPFLFWMVGVAGDPSFRVSGIREKSCPPEAPCGPCEAVGEALQWREAAPG
jgi:hypothetical protein